jgi:predicted DNA binding CopG/RHH family protein
MSEEAAPGKNRRTSSKDVLPEDFRTLEEFSELWDTHSTPDYEEVMEPVEVEIDPASSKINRPVARDLLLQIRQQARKQGVSTETLINLWLQAKLRASA